MQYNYFSPSPLFSDRYLGDYLNEKEGAMKLHIKDLKIEELENDGLPDVLFERYSIKRLIVNDQQKKVNAVEGDVEIRSQFFDDENRVVVKKGLIITVTIPFEGSENLFICKPSTYIMSGTPLAFIRDNNIILKYSTILDSPEEIKKLWLNDIEVIKKYVDWVNSDVDLYNNKLVQQISRLLTDRKNEAGKNKSLLNEILN